MANTLASNYSFAIRKPVMLPGHIGLYAFGMKSDITSDDYSIPSENVEFISAYLKF